MEQKFNLEKIIFRIPTSLGVFIWGLIALIIVTFFVFLGATSALKSISDIGDSLLVVFFSLVPLLGLFVVVRIIIYSRIVILEQDIIKIKYRILKRKNFDLELKDCIGYFPYSGGRQTRYSTVQNGVILKFSHGFSLKLGTTNYNQIKEIETIQVLLKNKCIKNFNPSGTVPVSFTNSITKIADQAFLSQ